MSIPVLGGLGTGDPGPALDSHNTTSWFTPGPVPWWCAPDIAAVLTRVLLRHAWAWRALAARDGDA